MSKGSKDRTTDHIAYERRFDDINWGKPADGFATRGKNITGKDKKKDTK